jgi:hypothetical protein
MTLRFQRAIAPDVTRVTSLLRQRSDMDDWKEMADLIERVFAADVNWRELYERVTAYYAGGKVSFGMVALLGCILHSPTHQSLAFQISLAKNLEQLSLKRSSIWKEIVEPFFLAYWDNAVANGDLAFRTAPSYAQRRVTEISAGEPGGRARPLLREMLFCVGLTLPGEHRDWLETE